LALLNQDMKKVWRHRRTRSTPCKSLRDLIFKFHMDIQQRRIFYFHQVDNEHDHNEDKSYLYKTHLLKVIQQALCKSLIRLICQHKFHLFN
jgi:hypothetical protein